MSANDRSIERLEALVKQVDVAFADIQGRHAARMQCRAGCSACCRARLSITRVEEAFVLRGLATLSDARRDELAARTREEGRENCPALDADGRCGIYPFRPLICRTYGLPLRHRRPVALIHPPVIDACDLNFTGTSLALLPAPDVFDQTALVERLESIDGDHSADHGLASRERIPIARILAGETREDD